MSLFMQRVLLYLLSCPQRDRRYGLRNLQRVFAVFFSAIILTTMFACSRSPVVEYYTLIPVVAAEMGLADASELPAIQIVLPTLPALVDRAEYTELATENRVHVHENVRWAVGLRKIIRDYFVSHLKQAIPNLNIQSSANQIAAPNTRKLAMVFDRFDIYAGQYVDISLSWHFSGGSKKLFSAEDFTQRSEIRVKQDIIGEQPKEAIAAIRAALGQIGDEMSRTLLSQAQSGY